MNGPVFSINLNQIKSNSVDKNVGNDNKKENLKKVVFCLKYENFSSKESFIDFVSSLNHIFNATSSIADIGNDEYIVEAKNHENSSIPSLNTVDEAYQTIKTMPDLIRRCEKETNSVTNVIQSRIKEIYELKRKREVIKTEVLSMKDKINKLHINQKKNQKIRKEIQPKLIKLSDTLSLYP